ncbi:MAG: redoxin domain-containing protein [Betaproteobacteria bacterium]|nr:redoxin domain-containing protein [Betaproteobacteria bacterium]
MVGFEKVKAELDALGVTVFAASVDALDKATEVAAELSFPMAYGVAREVADKLGCWWEERRSIFQPANFIIDAQGEILASTYSDGPIGRMEAIDVVRYITFREAQLKK